MAWYSWLFPWRAKRRKARPGQRAIYGDVGALRGGRADRSSRLEKKLPHFHAMAGDTGRSRRGGTLEQIRSNIRNAFTPSLPVARAGMFAGRVEVLRTLIQSIEDQQLHVVVYGERGIGKTSLLHIFSQIARDARYIVRYASCGEDTDFSGFFRSIMKDIPLLYHGDFAPTSEETEKGRSLADLLPEGELTVAQVSEVFGRLAGTRVLLLLDEFDRASAPGFRRAIAELIKNLSDRSVCVQLVIAGVASNLTELIEHIPSIRRNILGLQLPNMEKTEIEELIHNGEAVCGLRYDEQVVETITAVAHGSPYVASLICQHAGIYALDREAVTVEKADVLAAVKRALAELEQRVSPRSLFAIANARTAHYGARLGLLARAVLNTGGRFQLDQVEAVIERNEAGRAFLDKMVNQYGLIKKVENVPGEVYEFAEDGVAVYLWMSFADGYFAAEPDFGDNSRPLAEVTRILETNISRVG
ncbi:MAG: ATP-binding protein [Sphingomonadales bacterium]|nr:MAG: ATP-binding protein [Sphingomonadales bacterium]TNF05295.1 MAG: ATP-binding protein [Sphingomonadales bacterium]